MHDMATLGSHYKQIKLPGGTRFSMNRSYWRALELCQQEASKLLFASHIVNYSNKLNGWSSLLMRSFSQLISESKTKISTHGSFVYNHLFA